MSLKSTFLKNECTTQYVFTDEFSMWEIVEYISMWEIVEYISMWEIVEYFSMWEIVEYFLLKYPKIYHLDQH